MLALTLLLTLTGPAIAQEPVTVRLDPVAGSGVGGTATIEARDDAAAVTLDVAGLPLGASAQAIFRAGTCDRPSASFGLLGTLTADATGRARLTTTTARASATGVPVTLSLPLLTSGNIAVQGLACGNGPEAALEPAEAARLPAAGGPPFLVVAGILGALGLFTLGGGLLLRR